MDDLAKSALLDAWAGRPVVTYSRAFASDALQVDGTIFALIRDGDMAFELPAERCRASSADGGALPIAVGTRVMREWVVVDESGSEQWPDLAEDPFAFVTGAAQ